MTYTIISRILNAVLLAATVVSAVLLISSNSHAAEDSPGFISINKYDSPDNKEIVNLTRHWASVLDDLAGSPTSLSTLFSKDDVRLDLIDKRIRNFAELENWIYSRQVRLDSSKHSIHDIKIKPKGDGVYILKFEYHVEESNVNGPFEISRIDQTWRVRIDGIQQALIHEIKESYLPYLTDSGLRIQC